MRTGRSKVAMGLAAVAFAAAACGPIDDPSIASDVERQLDRGEAFAAMLSTRTGTSPSVEHAIAAGYHERLRLGLGSPFRLIEYSLQDPRLEKDVRERLAWSLLARTAEGRSHQVDPRLLDAQAPELGRRHLTLIEGAIGGATDPDAGMLAVRLAYGMAAAESSVSSAVQDRVHGVAALVRDRVRSRLDAERLLRAAGDDTDPLALLTVWRVERLFEVERPVALSPAAGVEREAIALASRLLESVRKTSRPPKAGPVVQEAQLRERTVLSLEAARLLAFEAALHDAPPQTPVALAVWSRRHDGEDSGEADGFAARAINEERLAAEYALRANRGEIEERHRRALLRAAIGLRAYAQERPWFPSFGGPAARDLEDRFGLGSITFSEAVPSHWRPYYRRMLESALSDLQRVMPSLDLKGLNVRFDARSGSPGTLAVHDPGSRTVYLPPRTGAGTIAHEIAHDMDWQTALHRYRIRGDYGTDRAVRLSDQRLARVLHGLTAATFPERIPDPTSHAGRPAEVFARSIDWFVAVALAREGRLNGYLSSVQDDVLTGYGTVTPPDVTGTAGQALVALLDEVAPVYPETRRWFLGSYGRLRAPTAYDLSRRVAEASLSTTTEPEPDPAQLSIAEDRLDALEAVRDSVLGMVDSGCRAVGYDNGDVSARRALVARTTEARARGVALAAAGAVAGLEGREWLAARLDGRSRDASLAPEVVELLEGLADRVRTIGAPAYEPRVLDSPATVSCGPLPFLAD